MGYPSRKGPLAQELAALEARCSWEGECFVVPVKGYGEVRFDGNRGRMPAHRASYIVHNGPIPDGLLIRHTCDRPGCINPNHLLTGTHADNSRDKVERKRHRFGENHPNVAVGSDLAQAAVAEYLAGGQSQAKVAAKYGVSQTTVGKWVRGTYRADAGPDRLVQGKGNRALAVGGYAECGTRAGYDSHLRHGEVTCQSCRDANNEYLRAYKREWRKRRREQGLRAA